MYVWMKWCFRYKRSLPHTNEGIRELAILPRTVFERRLDAPDRSVHPRDSIVIRDWETLSRGMVESVSVHQRAGGAGNTLHSGGHSVSGDRSHLEVSHWICTRVSRRPLQLLQTSSQCLRSVLCFSCMKSNKLLSAQWNFMSLQVFARVAQSWVRAARAINSLMPCVAT